MRNNTRILPVLTVVILATAMLFTGCKSKKDKENKGDDARSETSQSESTGQAGADSATAGSEGVVVNGPKPMSPIDPSTLGPLNNLDLTLVPSNPIFAMVIHPAKACEQPKIGESIHDVLQKYIELAIGIPMDPAEVEQVIASVQLPQAAVGQTYARFVFAIRYKDQVDGAVKLQDIALAYGYSAIEQKDLDGHPYFESSNIQGFSGVVVDERTIIVMSGSPISQLILREPGAGPLVTRLSHADLDNELFMITSLESDSQNGQAMADELARMVPPQYKSFSEIPRLLRSISLSVDLGNEKIVSMEVNAVDQAAAKKLSPMVPQFVGMGQTLLLLQSTQNQDMPPAMRMGAQLLSEMLASLQKNQDKNTLSYSLQRPPLFDRDVPELLGSVSTWLDEEKERRMHARRLIGAFDCFVQFLYRDGQFPPAAISAPDGTPLLSWRVAVLPAIGEEELYKKFKLDEPWDSPNNIELLKQIPPIFEDPDNPSEKTRIQVIAGPNSFFNFSPLIPNEKIFGKVVLVETGPERAVPWTAPQDVVFDPAQADTFMQSLGTLSDEGLPCVMFSGQIRWLPANSPPAMLRSIFMVSKDEMELQPFSFSPSGIPGGRMSIPEDAGMGEGPGTPSVPNDPFSSPGGGATGTMPPAAGGQPVAPDMIPQATQPMRPGNTTQPGMPPTIPPAQPGQPPMQPLQPNPSQPVVPPQQPVDGGVSSAPLNPLR